MAEPFTLHAQLQNDCHVLGSLEDETLVLLHRNGSLHWFMLVPKTPALDFTDLPTEHRNALMDAATALASVLKLSLKYSRVNIGALGLVVPQLHLHVVGRRETDPCWPAPVWGNLQQGPTYSISHLNALTQKLGLALPGFAAMNQF